MFSVPRVLFFFPELGRGAGIVIHTVSRLTLALGVSVEPQVLAIVICPHGESLGAERAAIHVDFGLFNMNSREWVT